jgi:rare lipoprotein A (peptidoglycan hydrolase)
MSSPFFKNHILSLNYLFAFVLFVTCIGSSNAFAEQVNARAVCYGPGLYGHKTASGHVLRANTSGVAHRKLKLGSTITIKYKDKSAQTTVIDRGPYVNNLDIDVTEGLAKDLGFRNCAHFGSRTVTLEY